MTINISKRKEALMNIIMCRREISPNVRCPQALILLNYRLSVELQCTHPKLKLNVMILFTSFMERHLWQKAQEPIQIQLHNIFTMSPIIQRAGGGFIPTTLHCACLLVFNWHCHVCVFFPQVKLFGVLQKIAALQQAAVWAVIKSKEWFALLEKSELRAGWL